MGRGLQSIARQTRCRDFLQSEDGSRGALLLSVMETLASAFFKSAYISRL